MGDDGPAFVDTNILVYVFGRHGGERKEVAERLVAALMEERRIRFSTQVLQEFFSVLTRKKLHGCTPDEAIGYLDRLSAWPVLVVDYTAIREAAALSRDAMLAFWDALIVVAAARSGAKRLYTEDLHHGQVLLGVEVVNPFRAPA